MRTLRRRDARGEQGHRKLEWWQPEPTLHSARSRFKPRSLVSSAIRRFPAAEACRRELNKAVSTLSYPSIPSAPDKGQEARRSQKECSRRPVQQTTAWSYHSRQESCGGLEAAPEWTDHSSGCGGQERTVPNCRLLSTIVLSLVPELSELQTRARHSEQRTRDTESHRLSAVYFRVSRHTSELPTRFY